jgi:adenylosuccinate synthase
VSSFNDLPANAKKYIALIEKITGKPITIIGVGPKRNQTIFKND